MALRKTVARWFTVWLCPPSRFAQPQPMSSGSASCLQQTRFQTVCASRCYLTDGLGHLIMSTFAWLDHSEKQRRQMLEAIDLFREKDTRDEMGIAGIRDAFADMLFPGTGALQTRARYFLFIPWMYLQFDTARVSSAEVERKGREFEIELINRLADSVDPDGTIGIQSRSSLQRIPSSIYWNGLKLWGICQFPGSQAEYQHSFDRQRATNIRRNDDGEIVGLMARSWHANVPPVPASFPSQACFTLTSEEARYLKGRVLETHRPSLFAFLLDHDYVDVDAEFIWTHPASQQAPIGLQRKINHARCFSEVMHGAAILYNLFLGELDPIRDEVIKSCETMLDEWFALLSGRHQALATWDREDFWNLLSERMKPPSFAAHQFVEAWCNLVLSGNVARLRADEGAKRLIFNREAEIKGALARCNNRRSREMWRGDAGTGRLGFRWSNARVLLRDISGGLVGEHA
jgi:hypothetical protein